FQAEDGIRDFHVTGVQTCALPICESFRVKAQLVEEGESLWLCTGVAPPPHLLIVGGGIDARPLATIGHQLGWHISVWDPRPANRSEERRVGKEGRSRGREDRCRTK